MVVEDAHGYQVPAVVDGLAEDYRAAIAIALRLPLDWDLPVRNLDGTVHADAKLSDQQIPPVSLRRATFTGRAEFRATTFAGTVDLREATFTDYAHFTGAQFAHQASFRQAIFTGPAFFDGAGFASEAFFDEVTFTGDSFFPKPTSRKPPRSSKSLSSATQRSTELRSTAAPVPAGGVHRKRLFQAGDVRRSRVL